jgi:tetratricopeptide (TPR) repeat protein
MKNCNWLIAGLALLGCGCLTVPRPTARVLPPDCGQALNADLGEWNFDSALARTDRCIGLEQAGLAALRGRAASEAEAGAAIRAAESAIAHFLCVRIQVLALKGEQAGAEEALKEAELFNREHPEAGMTLAVNNSLLPITRAFVLEKSGDYKGAAAAYREIVAATRAAGINALPDCLCGRLAVIALESGDDKAAARWSRQTASFDSGAKAVQGALLQKAGDERGARDNYEAALKLLEGASSSGDQTLPIYFAEQKRVREGLAEVIKEIFA